MAGTASIGLKAGPGGERFSELESDLVRLSGRDAAHAFLAAYAGTCIRIPQTVQEGSPLANAMGLLPAKAFAAEYGGETIHVPMGPLSAANARAAAMRTLLLQGLSVREIAASLKCSDRGVRRARQRLRLQGLLP